MKRNTQRFFERVLFEGLPRRIFTPQQAHRLWVRSLLSAGQWGTVWVWRVRDEIRSEAGRPAVSLGVSRVTGGPWSVAWGMTWPHLGFLAASIDTR